MVKNNFPLFSIIIPTYNHGHLIHRCLESILAQTYENWEAIIINNFSSDNTFDVVSKYKDPRIRLINFANNGIIAGSRNKGIMEAKGEWICFLDSDDWWENDKLMTTYMYADNYDFIYHKMELRMKTNSKFKKYLYSRQVKGNIAKYLLVNSNCICNSSVSIRKSIVDSIGLLGEDENLIAVEDFDYWIRVSLYTNRFKYIQKCLGFYWIDKNVSLSIIQINRESALYHKYKHLLTIKEREVSQNLLHYNSAKIYYYNMKFDLALKMFYNLFFCKLSIVIKIKSFIYLILCVYKICSYAKNQKSAF